MEYFTFLVVLSLILVITFQLRKKEALEDRIGVLEIKLYEEQTKNKELYYHYDSLKIEYNLLKRRNKASLDNYQKECRDLEDNLQIVISKFLRGNLYAIPSGNPTVDSPGTSTGCKCDVTRRDDASGETRNERDPS